MAQRVQNEGTVIGGRKTHLSPSACEVLCDNTATCKSFSHSGPSKECWLYDKELTGFEPQYIGLITGLSTWYKTCSEFGYNE